MQFEISDEAAITLTSEFYEALSDGYPVDAALAEARRAIFEEENELEWATPVLYMRSPDGLIFDLKEPVSGTVEREAEETSEWEAQDRGRSQGRNVEGAGGEGQERKLAERDARERLEREWKKAERDAHRDSITEPTPELEPELETVSQRPSSRLLPAVIGDRGATGDQIALLQRELRPDEQVTHLFGVTLRGRGGLMDYSTIAMTASECVIVRDRGRTRTKLEVLRIPFRSMTMVTAASSHLFWKGLDIQYREPQGDDVRHISIVELKTKVAAALESTLRAHLPS